MSYPWKTEPFSHQREWWEKTKDNPAWAILWEQGTGKTKYTIDTAAHLYLQGEIDAIVVVAPNGVHRNWTVNEIPIHMPDSVECTMVLWDSSKAGNKAHQRHSAKSLTAPGLFVLAISYHGIMTKAGDAYLAKVLKGRTCLMLLDESTQIKNPRAKWTVRALARGKAAKYRRILTGTPVTNCPFDVFSQYKFLDPTIWDSLGCRTFAAFKQFFGVWAHRVDPRSGRLFPDLIRYRNLNILAEVTQRVGCRVLKKDVLDLPDKLYSKRYFDITPEQRRLYKEMKNTFEILLETGEITAMLAIVQLLRFQQIISGFLVDDEKNVIPLKENPRLNTFREIAVGTEAKFIVWAKFVHDIDTIMAALKEEGIEAVRYDGSTKLDARGEAIERFQNGTARAFVSNPTAAGRGLTLTAATLVIYYNNSFKLEDRLQSEDRPHRIGQKNPVTYIDLVATETVDERIVDALRAKQNIADQITGDAMREWI